MENRTRRVEATDRSTRDLDYTARAVTNCQEVQEAKSVIRYSKNAKTSFIYLFCLLRMFLGFSAGC